MEEHAKGAGEYCSGASKAYAEGVGSDSRLNDEFIHANFEPVKLSSNAVKNLSRDYSDQTLGGRRKYNEVVVDGRRMKIYEYVVKIMRCMTEHGKEEIKVENGLLVPRPFMGGNENRGGSLIHPARKRGRPRKYPKGMEPYKKRRKTQDASVNGALQNADRQDEDEWRRNMFDDLFWDK